MKPQLKSHHMMPEGGGARLVAEGIHEVVSRLTARPDHIEFFYVDCEKGITTSFKAVSIMPMAGGGVGVHLDFIESKEA